MEEEVNVRSQTCRRHRRNVGDRAAFRPVVRRTGRRRRHHRPYPGSTTVTTANGGISALVRTLAVELSPVRVNALHPSIVADTPFWSDKPAARQAAATHALTRRPVTMQDCTGAIRFLLENR